ncbi:MAG: ADP-L-glycero-D-manno-heptose 6-epimerase [Planctomycetota bacterium]|jgi:ADP-L-glycero-D-manno-heptose 6-epimerase
MIVVTGARGFIASFLVEKLNKEGRKDLVLVDELENRSKDFNLEEKDYLELLHRDNFMEWFSENAKDVEFIYHLGARTDTAEFDVELFNRLNLNYTKDIWHICTENNIPLVYASSAATYGNGEHGYNDEAPIKDLKPLNPYGYSKQDFDLWVETQTKTPPFYAGLKFFNVYGKGEWHKGRMSSVIYIAFNQITETEKMKLFMSHNPDYKNGEQKRDFVYVKDLTDMCFFFQESFENKHKVENGIYNIGTGTARTFNDLVLATFKAMNIEADISYIPTPEDIRDKYQYFTEATMQKMRKAGYDKPFTSLEDGVMDYVQEYLMKK